MEATKKTIPTGSLVQARHSFAVMAINRGMRIEMLSKLLGHSSIISTEKTYARFLRSTVDAEIRKLMEWQ